METLRQPAALRLSLVAVTTIAFIVTGSPQRRTVHAQTNPIVDENLLAGTPQAEWDISGSGDPAIQGFATDISVNTGNVVTFKIKLGLGVPGYVIDVYRLGYYQGFGARKVGTVEPTMAQISASQNQPACLRDDAAGLVDCGNWGVSGTFDTSGMTSGIFIARPRRTDTGGASHIVFIVRDDARKADVLFQTSDTTWQAYNQYPGLADGGSSLYCNGPLDNSAGDYGCATRSAKVSYNRPFDTRDHDRGSWLFNAEFPMVRWMEANGYDLKYWSGVDTDRLGADPAIGLRSALAPKAFFSVGHDEYWSGQQRANVEHARDGGLNLAFFSGNEMFWKTRYESSIDGSGTAYRTLVSYKETFATGTSRLDPDPASPWTGTWRDPRFSPPLDGGRPENGLTGTLWTVNCCSSRLIVSSEFKGHRFWRNTAVALLQPGEVYLSSPEILGYEWDEDVDNGFRPAGLARLSATTLDEPETLLDFGVNVGPGTPTHALTLYRHDSGALVFGAGTVQWSWGLDAVHDRLPTSPDRAVQQATVNLLADMGAQPLTLQRGADDQPLVSASTSGDVVAPATSITFPAAGASVPSGSRVTITGQVTEFGGGSPAGVEVSVDGSTWHPALMPTPTTFAYNWRAGALGQATIRARAVDDSGNMEHAGPGVTVNVVTGECPCTSLWNPSAVPVVASAADAKPVEVGLKFYSDSDGFITGVRFYKGPANTSTHVGNLWTATGTLLATAVFTDETATGWQQVLFSSPVAIAANTTYVVSYHTNIGGYAADAGYLLTSGVDSPPLHAATSAVAQGNGLFSYGASQFPTETFTATNYWVDVVYAPSVTDTTPPVVSRIKSTIVDSARVTVTWTTDELSTSKIEYSTDPALLTSTTTLPPGTITINQASFVLQHSVALTGLASNTTYYYRVVSVDRSGNAADVAAPTFTVPGPTLRDTSSPDFAAGTPSGTYVSESGNGEVMLAPVVGTEFSGSTFDPGWSAVQWDAGGFASVGNGVLLVDGTRVGTCDPPGSTCQEVATQSPGHRLEFVATFSGDGFQHAGFGRTLVDGPWAIFSTDHGGTIMARSMTAPGGAVANDEIPNGSTYLGAPHRYAIDWRTDRVDYYIDGALVKSHVMAVQGPMRPIAASDFSPFGGNVVVNWMRLSPYAAAGTFESRVFDASDSVDWRTIQWSATTAAGASVDISVRAGDTPTPDGGWTAWQPVPTPGPLSLRARYIQYRASLATNDVDVTPSLDDIIITTGQAPVAVDDSISVPRNGLSTLPATGAGSLVANDIDGDGDPLDIVAVGPASHGTVALQLDGSVRYAPQANYSGPDAFTYTVSDGLMTSSATVSVVVQLENSPPIAKNDAYTVNEDSGTTTIDVVFNDTDPDAGQTLTVTNVSAPSHGVASIAADGRTIIYAPAADFFGPDSFEYTISDGRGGVSTATVSVDVLAVNDAPSFMAGANPRVREDAGPQAIANWATAISAGPVNESTQAVAFSITGNSNPALFSAGPAVNAAGTLTFTPLANASGTATLTLVATDNGGTLNGGVDRSAPLTFTITVVNVNDAPSFVKGADVTVLEDAGPQSIAGWATAISAGPVDEGGQALNFIVTTTSDALFAARPAISPAGTLTFTPAPDANGVATVTVQLHDDGGVADGGVDTSAPQTFVIAVSAVNDNPIANPDSATVLEDAGVTSINVLSNDTIGPDTGETLTVTGVTQAAHGSVAFTPTGVTYAAAGNYNGSDTFSYTVGDGNGGTATARVSVTVTAVNDAPSFIKGADQTSVPGAGPQTVAAWATGISAGPPDEATQILTFVVTSDNPGLFAAQPAIAPNGTLTYTPAASGGGMANVTVRLQDDGGTANGGVNASAPQTFTIAIPYPTTTTLTSPTVSPTTFGQAVVLNASVTSAAGPVTGAVDFTDNGVLLGTVPLANGAASLTTSAIGAGTARTVKAIYRAASGFLSSEATLTRAVTAAATTTTLTATSAQYSDATTFQTTVTGVPAAAPAQSATFSVGTEVIGTANLTWDGVAGLYRASYTGPLVESTYTSTGGPLKPGSKNIKVVYNGVSPNYTLAARSGSFAINREDAAVTYVGATTVLCGTSCSAVVVPLKAKVGEIDASPGDLRNANVTFVNRTTGLAIATVAVDGTGTASFNWTVNLGTAASQTTKIGMVVGNYYVRSNTLDDGTVVIKR